MLNVKVRVENLNFSYHNRNVLNVTEAKFEKGKAYGIVGKNGTGKTTFFKCLVNIIVNYDGRVLIDDEDVRANPKMLGNVGIVLDDMNLYRNRSGMFNIRYFSGLRGGVDEERILELARELGIDRSLGRNVAKYSLGMKKKLQLLISLMNEAEVLIFDEPFRGLDAGTVEWFRAHLLGLKEQGRTILISSHVQEDIEAISDYVLLLENGDFVREFDLLDKAQEFIYTVDVNDNESLLKLLEDVEYKELGDSVQFVLNEQEYRELFKKAVASDIEFYQIKKESQFAKFVK